MLDWIFEGIIDWVAGIASSIMDAISGLFLNALGTDMTAMEEYFPFVSAAFDVMQYMAWALLFLICVWQLFRVFGGPITDAENPWQLVVRSCLFGVLVGYAKPIFTLVLDIARAPYTALLDVQLTGEDFTFAGLEEVISNGLVTIASTITVIAPLLLLILLISVGWNYFKLLLETVERYIVVGVLCYTSPLAFAMGGSKATSQIFASWCRMVGSQLLLLVLNVWFLRALNSSVGQYIANGGALTSGQGSIFLWFFCALAFLKTAQRFDSYLASLGLNVAQTGSSMGMGGSVGFVGRAFGGMAARNGAVLTGDSIASVASRPENVSGSIAGDIADRSLANYMPQLGGHTLSDTQITGGHISTSATDAAGNASSVELFNAAQYDKPDVPRSVVTASDGSTWYQMASGEGSGAFYDAPTFTGSADEASAVASAFPGIDGGTMLRTVEDGVMEATSAGGSSLWYNSAYYDEPDAPHEVVTAANGVDWYAMQPPAETPTFEAGEEAAAYNRAMFQDFMPGYAQPVTAVEGENREDGHFAVRHADGSGTAFYDTAIYVPPRGDYQVYEDKRGQQWIAIHGTPGVEQRPVYQDGKPVYENGSMKTVKVETVKYGSTPGKYPAPRKRAKSEMKPPRKKRR